jgi:hypothetical protein
MAPQQRYAIGNDNNRYELMGNLNGQRFQDVYVIDVNNGDRTLALERARWYNGASPDGTHLLYYEDGDYYTYEIATGTRRNISENVDTSFINTEDDHNIVDPPILCPTPKMTPNWWCPELTNSSATPSTAASSWPPPAMPLS